MELLIGIMYIGVLVFLANQQALKGRSEQERFFVPMLYGVIFMMTLGVMTGISLLVAPAAMENDVSVNPLAGIIFLVVGIGLTMLAMRLMQNPALRSRIPDFLPGGNFDATSPVHFTALLLMLLMIVIQLSGFILIGGQSGVEENMAQQEGSVGLLLLGDLITYLLLATLGVGLWIRRTEAQTLERLGLRIPDNREILMGFAVGTGMFFFIQVLSGIFILFTAPEIVAQQEAISQGMMQLFGQSLIISFLLAASSAIGEEILFRGALQPVFGVFASTAFFAIMHIQYTFTPSALLIFIVGLSFAWLRQRYSTTAAIIAHFVYNLIPFLLLALVPGVV